MEITLGNSGAYEAVAEGITDAIFWTGGAIEQIGQSLSNVLTTIMDGVYDSINPFNGQTYDPVDLGTFDLIPGDDDVNGVTSDFSSSPLLETASVEQVQLQTAFVGGDGGGGDGGGYEVDEPIGSGSIPITPGQYEMLAPEIAIA